LQPELALLPQFAGAAMSASGSKSAAKTGAQGAANAAAIDWERSS